MKAFISSARIPFNPAERIWRCPSPHVCRGKRRMILITRMNSPPSGDSELGSAKDTLKGSQHGIKVSGNPFRPATHPKFQGYLPLARTIDQFLNHPLTEVVTAGLVMGSCAIFALETVELPPLVDFTLISIEKIISILFFIEYIARWYSKNFRLRFLLTRLMLIDFVAILPLFFYQFGSFAQFDLQFVRLLRVGRVFRLQRILDKTEFRNIFGDVPSSRLKTTEILLTIFSLVYVSAGLYYDAEHEINPQVRNFFDSVYYTLGILTTANFGSQPVGAAGQVVTAITVVIGALIVPFQLGALAKTTLGEMMTEYEKDEYEMSGVKENGVPFLTELQCSRCTLKMHQADARFCRICGAPLPTEPRNPLGDR